jgi:hypothetical protein
MAAFGQAFQYDDRQVGPIVAVEFSDIANHVNCTTRQRSRSAAA